MLINFDFVKIKLIYGMRRFRLNIIHSLQHYKRFKQFKNVIFFVTHKLQH